MDRIIGHYKGNSPGPLTVVFGAMHGNEPAGVLALKELFNRLDHATASDPHFKLAGDIVGLVGNVQAFEAQKRFITKDLNRSWVANDIRKVMDSPENELKDEDKELRQIVQLLNTVVDTKNFGKMFILDLHTTSSEGAVFSIASEDSTSESLALQLGAPVILGLVNTIEGTSLHFFNNKYLKIPTIALGFECGHHEDPHSPLRALSAILNFLTAINVINNNNIVDSDYELNLNNTHSLPRKVKIVHREQVNDISKWKMKEGYTNFQHISKNEVLGFYEGVEVKSPYSGRILMPLYQAQGQDGFFIVEEIE